MTSEINPVVVAIPACNEADNIRQCLAALAVQRDGLGAPVAAGAFEILVLANNCTDATAALCRDFAMNVPQQVTVIEEQLLTEMANAGWARKRVMDLAADRLERMGGRQIIMTTDADSCVGPTWFSTNLLELEKGVHCVAGYIDADAHDIVSLGSIFLARGRLEDTYLRLVAEIFARCDAQDHDPWPNHRVSSGASLAVTLAAYRAIGGLPAQPLGEDAALTASLEEAGFKVRHSLDVTVQTSCRMMGRAKGGAADTMRYRLHNPNALCDGDLEPALQLTRRAVCRGLLRRSWKGKSGETGLSRRLKIPTQLLDRLRAEEATFLEMWEAVSAASPLLSARHTLRPSQLPRQIAIARWILATLRSPSGRIVPNDRRGLEGSAEREFA